MTRTKYGGRTEQGVIDLKERSRLNNPANNALRLRAMQIGNITQNELAALPSVPRARLLAEAREGSHEEVTPVREAVARVFEGVPFPTPAPLEEIEKFSIYTDPDAPVHKVQEPRPITSCALSQPGWLYIHLDDDLYDIRGEFKIGASTYPPKRLLAALTTASRQHFVFRVRVNNMKRAEDLFKAICAKYNVPGEGHRELFQMDVADAIEIMQEIADQYPLTPEQLSQFKETT